MTKRYPPVALGYLDDESRWLWISPRPVGLMDWALMIVVSVLALPVLIVFGPIVAVLRIFGGKGR